MNRVGQGTQGANRQIPVTPGKGFPMAMGLTYRAMILRNGTSDKGAIASALHAMGFAESSEVYYSREERDQSRSATMYPWPTSLDEIVSPVGLAAIYVQGEWVRRTGFAMGRPYPDGSLVMFKVYEFDPEYLKKQPSAIPDDPFGIKRALSDVVELAMPALIGFLVVKAIMNEKGGRR